MDRRADPWRSWSRRPTLRRSPHKLVRVSASSPLPVLDISGFRSDPDGPAGAAFVEALQDAFHGIGAAYLVGHGVPDRWARVRQVAEEFFALPEAQRLAIENVHSPQFRGYTRLGNEHTNGRRDLRDQVDVGRELPAPELGADDPAWLRLRGPNLWPEGLPAFRAAVSEYNAAVEQAGHELMRAVSLALGQPADHFDALVETPEVLTKIIRYPAPSEDFPTDQGVGQHTDAGFLTLLHQDTVGGFEAEVYGQWVAVPALPGSFVVNIGELLQLVSSGYFPPPRTAWSARPRASSASRSPTSSTLGSKPGSCRSRSRPHSPPRRRGREPDPDNPILSNYGFNTLKVRLRAHPDVAERHHADLLARSEREPGSGDERQSVGHQGRADVVQERPGGRRLAPLAPDEGERPLEAAGRSGSPRSAARRRRRSSAARSRGRVNPRRARGRWSARRSRRRSEARRTRRGMLRRGCLAERSRAGSR